MRAAASLSRLRRRAGHYRHRAATSRSVRVRDGVLPAGPRRGRVGGGEPRPPPPRALDVDRDALEAAVRDMLRALGEDVHREGLADTPKRVAKAMAFAVRGYGMSATHHVESALFHEPGLKSDEEALAEALADDEPPALCAPIPADPSALARPSTVLIRDVPFFSTNEDNLLPFYGRCHIGYVPRDGVIVGLSKVARVAEVFARRAQTPDRLAADIADAIARGAAPRGVRVFLEGRRWDPTNQRPSAAKRTSGVSNPRTRRGRNTARNSPPCSRRRWARGSAPGWASAGEEDPPSPERRRARGVSRPSPEGRYPSPNIVDDVEVGSVTTTTRLSIGDGEGDGDRVGGGASREGAGGGSTDRGSGSDGGSHARRTTRRRTMRRCVRECREETRTLPSREREGWWFARRVWTIPGRGPRRPRSPRRPRREETRQASPGRRPGGGGGGGADDARVGSRRADVLGQTRGDRSAIRKSHGGVARGTRHGGETRRRARGFRGWGSSGMDAPASGDKRKRRAEDRPDAKDATDGSFEMVVERDLELATLCEHHLLPFHGAVHVAYLRPASGGSGSASGSGLAREALQRVVTKHGRRFQVQERLTRDIARDVIAAFGARGVMVAVRASHLCMIARGWKNRGPPRARARVSAPSRGAAREEARFGARSRAKRAGRRVEDECQIDDECRRCVSTMRVDDECPSLM